MRKALRILRKILFWTFFVCLFITTTVTVLLYIYEDDIKQYAIDELEAQLNTKIDVQDIDLSLFHDFPSASLEFKNVFIADAYQEMNSEDTLLFAEKIFFNFSLMDIWREDYKVKRISAHNGELNLKTSVDGDYNYGILRKDTVEREKNFHFMLELLKLENIALTYDNNSTHQHYEIDVIDGLLQGDFNSDDYQLLADGDLFIHKIKSNSFSLIKEKTAHLDLDMDVDKFNKLYTFNKGDLTVEEMPFKITGEVDSASIDLAITGHNVQLDQLANSLVDESLEDAKQYNGKGVIDFKSEIKGPISKTEMPSVSADFSLIGGSLTEPESNLTVTDVNLIGHYHNSQKNREEELNFENLSFRLLKSHFRGTAEMKDFAQPTLKSDMKGDLDLAAFDRFFGFKNVEKISGHLKVNLAAEIQFFDPEYRKDEFDIIEADGHLTLSEINYQKEGDDLYYQNINGDLVIHGKDAATRDLTFNTDKSDFKLDGALKNFVPFLEGNDGLGIIASIESDNIDLNEFVSEKEKKEEGPIQIFELPSDLNMNLELHLGSLNWDNHHFENISGQLLYANRKATLNKFKVNTLGGSARGSLSLTNALQDGNGVEGNIKFDKINMKQLFAEWDNFQQKSITDRHLSGKANGSIEFFLGFNPYMSIIEEKIYAKADLNIQEGELSQLDMMKDITEYMRSNKGLKLLLNKHIDKFEQKLLNLKFSDLRNTIEIRDRKIHIPKMTIVSNALDLDLFGWHDFDNNVDYHFSFRFRDLKSKPEYNEFGKIEDDGLGLVIFLSMTGNLDDPTFALDKDERKNNIKENLASEKEDIKSILKTEFGLFKNDTTVQRMQKSNEQEVEFIFYDEDIEVQGIQDTVKRGRNKNRSLKVFDKLKKKSRANEEVEFEIEEDEE